MSPDRDTDRVPPDSDQGDVYTENEAGEPGLAGRADDDHGMYQAYSDDSNQFTDPKVYVPLVLGGAALLLFPEPLTSMLGLFLVLLGLFIGAVDVLSPS